MPYVNHYSFHIVDRDWGHSRSRSVAIRHSRPKSCSTAMSGSPVRPRTLASVHERGKLFHAHLRSRRLRADRRHLVRSSDDRAVARGLRAVDLFGVSVLRARSGRADAGAGFAISIRITNWSTVAISSSRRRAHGRSVSSADRPHPPRMDLRTVKTILGYQRRPRYRRAAEKDRRRGKSPSRDLCTI